MSKRVIKWSDARLFCNLVASTADTVVTWQVFDDSPAKDHTKARSLRGSLSDKKFRDRLQAANEAGCGIYITANTCDDTGKRRAENVTGYTASFIDLDGAPLPDAPAVAFDIILETSPGKFHCWWLLQAGTDLALWSDTQARLAAFYGSDPVVHDASRVARCPGFWHLKNPAKPFMVRLQHATTAEFERGELSDLAAAHPAEYDPPGAAGGDNAPDVEPAAGWDNYDDVQQARGYIARLDPSDYKAFGDKELLVAALTLRDYGISPDLRFEMLCELNARADTPWDDDVLRDKIRRPGKNEPGCRTRAYQIEKARREFKS